MAGRRRIRVALAVVIGWSAAGCDFIGLEQERYTWTPPISAAQATREAERQPCAEREPNRRAFFGDLHVHTSRSFDTWTHGTRTTVDDAYRFARGEEIPLAGGRRSRLARALDFAAVTDHAEWLGEVSLCTRPGSTAYDSRTCRTYRGERVPWVGRIIPFLRMPPLRAVMDRSGRDREVCGEGGTACRGAALSVWNDNQRAAEKWQDRSSACAFSTFHAYEYTANPAISKVHRNVVFRNASVPELPVSWVDEPEAPELWRRLEETCLESGSGCDVISIPHNPNLSNGRMFALWYQDLAPAAQREEAALRARLEPLVEMMQAKGESECRNGLSGIVGARDELCDFEKIRGLADPPEDCGEGSGSGAMAGFGCISRRDFVRYVLTEGLREESRLGVNPFRFGLIGSTDTHNSNPGSTDERRFEGTSGLKSDTAIERLSPEARSSLYRSPGGLAGIYAEENSRESLFAAMKRRETFATSGTRIIPRFFGAWDLPAQACGRPDQTALGYENGVPMGSLLPERPGGSESPIFLLSALRDPGSPGRSGGLLQRIQLIKGWVDADGQLHQEVHDVAGESENGADVDLATCTPRGPGADALCAAWSDPDFDPTRPAVYYARVLENPSCRWSAHQCLALPAAERPESCSDPGIPKLIQERAWTSPIWYVPGAQGES